MDALLCESRYVDFTPNVIMQSESIFAGSNSLCDYAEKAYHFVRDDIAHSFDVNAEVVTAKASEVLEHKVGLCHPKSALLVALLRIKRIPAGFKMQKLTLADDISSGHCIHGYCAAYLDGAWVELDARGNKAGINAQFSRGKPMLAFEPREELGEIAYNGIFAEPHLETMQLLEKAPDMEYVYKNMSAVLTQAPVMGKYIE